jgi:hypothetical protein
MSNEMKEVHVSQDDSFSRAADQLSKKGSLQHFWDFLRYNRNWWLIPVLLALLVASVAVILGGTAAAPFIYTLF